MGRPKQVSDEEILEVACECFLEQGPSVPVQVIADKVGLSQPALFKRFNTKEELLMAALAPPERLPALDWIDSGPGEAEMRQEVQRLIEKVWQAISTVLPRLAVLHMSNISPGQIQRRYKRLPLIALLEAVAGFFRRAQAAGRLRADADPTAWAQICVGALQGRAFLRFLLRADFGPGADSSYLDSLVDLLWRGMSDESEMK